MLKPLFKLEEGLLRVERVLLVIFVLAMLLLAAYTVFYRNVLVPWQNRLIVSGPPVVEASASGPGRATEAATHPEAGDDDEVAGDFAGGFGGGFGDADDSGAEAAEEDFAGGFGGGFGDAADDEKADDSAEEADDAEDDFAGGFGGGFGDDGEGDAPQGAEEAAGDDFSGGFGGGFGDADEADAEPDEASGAQAVAPDNAPVEPEPPRGGPPPEGSLAAGIIWFINAIKFSWIDNLLRQLVIICGFLGAMLAARRRNHISIDVFGRFLKGRAAHISEAITSFAAVVVCVLLVFSGWALVQLGIEFPRQIIPWVTQWQFQLIFPIGWGLLAFHFLMRVLESIDRAIHDSKGPGIRPGASQSETAQTQGGAP